MKKKENVRQFPWPMKTPASNTIVENVHAGENTNNVAKVGVLYDNI